MMKVSPHNTANRACSLIYSYIKTYNQGIWLLPVNVCPDVPLTFCIAGVKFEFVDICPETFCIDENECIIRLRNLKKEYAGIVYVRTYGYLSDTAEFFSKCKSIRPFLKVLDDRCLCIPQRNPVFFNADMVLYSTGHCKQIDFGGGGLAYYVSVETYYKDTNLFFDGTNEEILYKQAYANNTVLEPIPRGWLKLDRYLDYQTYIEKIELESERRINQRKKINKVYNENLPAEIQMTDEFNHWRFNIKVPLHKKERILKALFAKGLFASSHYHSANKLFDKEIYPHSDNLYSTVINLFNDVHYTEDQAVKTSIIINSIIQ